MVKKEDFGSGGGPVLIRREALELMLGAAREVYPDEFMAMLRGEGNLITEVLIIPASTFGDGFSSAPDWMVPLNAGVVGSVHSHPSRDNRFSDMDLVYFGKMGGIHLILGYPYQSILDVAAYASDGRKLQVAMK
ncbi:putative metalloprotease [uncultured archaeon]|nr:putative metalloprotease [uncultured archaeon]